MMLHIRSLARQGREKVGVKVGVSQKRLIRVIHIKIISR